MHAAFDLCGNGALLEAQFARVGHSAQDVETSGADVLTAVPDPGDQVRQEAMNGALVNDGSRHALRHTNFVSVAAKKENLISKKLFNLKIYNFNCFVFLTLGSNAVGCPRRLWIPWRLTSPCHDTS